MVPDRVTLHRLPLASGDLRLLVVHQDIIIGSKWVIFPKEHLCCAFTSP